MFSYDACNLLYSEHLSVASPIFWGKIRFGEVKFPLKVLGINTGFWATVCKTVRPILSDSCLSVCPVCSVCDVGVLWPNGWMDQDETWHASRPWSWPHCVRWGPGPPPPKGLSPQFSAHICCGQMTLWITMPLGMEVGLGPGHIVILLDGDPAPSSPKGDTAPNFQRMFVVAKRLDGSRCHLVRW